MPIESLKKKRLRMAEIIMRLKEEYPDSIDLEEALSQALSEQEV